MIAGIMKERVAIGVCLAVTGIWLLLVLGNYGYRSTSFAGPGFHASSPADSRTVFAALTKQLTGMGFTSSTSPYGSGFTPGVSTVGATNSWFVRELSRGQAIHVRVEADEHGVRTSMKWESRGFRWQARSTKRLAYSEALALDTWFAGRREPNEIPLKFREEKRQYFEEKLAGMEAF